MDFRLDEIYMMNSSDHQREPYMGAESIRSSQSWHLNSEFCCFPTEPPPPNWKLFPRLSLSLSPISILFALFLHLSSRL